jgi:carbamoylphosphate synthase large subunit
MADLETSDQELLRLSDQELLRLIDGAERTAASMNRDLILDEKKLSLVGATVNLIEKLRNRNLIRDQ